MRCETNSFIHQSSQQHKCRSAHKNHLPSTRHVALSSISQLLPQQQYPPPCPALPAPTCQSPLLPRPLPLRPVTDPWTVVLLPPPPRASLPPRTTRRKPRPRARSKAMKDRSGMIQATALADGSQCLPFRFRLLPLGFDSLHEYTTVQLESIADVK